MITVYLGYILVVFISEPNRANQTIIEKEILPVQSDNVVEQPTISVEDPVKDNEIKEIESLQIKQLRLNQIRISEGIDIENRKPILPATTFTDTIPYLYCFTGVDNRTGPTHQIHHIWKYNDRELTTIDISIGRSVHWRCWSRIKINPEWTGKWSVTILDSNNVEFGSTQFTIVPSDSI